MLFLCNENPQFVLGGGSKKLIAMSSQNEASLLELSWLDKKLERKVSNIKDNSGLAHSKWNCKYHMVFAPKYRRMLIYRKLKQEIGEILRMLCKRKGIEILEAEACPVHIHMLVEIPPKYSVAEIMGYLKGKSSLIIFDRHTNLKYKYGQRSFWCIGYFVDTVEQNKIAIEEYIRNQLSEDKIAEELSFKELIDPFAGKRNKKL